MTEAKAMNAIGPATVAEALDAIEEIVESSPVKYVVYLIVKVPARYDGSLSVVCDVEIVKDDYDVLCVKLFDLDVSGWRILDVSAKMQEYMRFLVVTIRVVENG